MTITTFEGFDGVEPKTVATPEDLDAFELPGGLALPTSYRDYAEHLGHGLTCGPFPIYIPMGEHYDSLSVRMDRQSLSFGCSPSPSAITATCSDWISNTSMVANSRSTASGQGPTA